MKRAQARCTILIVGSGDSKQRSPAVALRALRCAPVKRKGQRGLALISAMTAIAILAAMLTDFHEYTSTSYAVAIAERDRLRAEYLARSAQQLTRLLIANEPMVRQLVAPIYQALLGKAPAQVPVWTYANELLAPFCNSEETTERAASMSGLDLKMSKGLDNLDGTCEVLATAENSKINVNRAPGVGADANRKNIAMQLNSLTGGTQIPNSYDALFKNRDEQGDTYSRIDVIGNIIDWWDFDQSKTVFDPVTMRIDSAAAEDNRYRGLRDPYSIKNAPYDSLDELHMVGGISEEFWATFIQPDPQRPDRDLLTVYGTSEINPNEARPEVMLARVCSVAITTSLCADPLEGAKFVQLMRTVRNLFPVPWFQTGQDFINFITGKGGPNDLFQMLGSFLGGVHPLMFKPVILTPEQNAMLLPLFSAEAYVFTIQTTAAVGTSRIRIRSIANFNPRWVPPPPNASVSMGLGVSQYWRVE